MAKKDVCICCGSRKTEYKCEKCGGSICDDDSIFIDIGVKLSQSSQLKLNKLKKHPAFFLCLNTKGEGCAKNYVKLMLEGLKW